MRSRYASRMTFFDAHCHLQDEALFPNFGDVLQRAVDAGVEQVACSGTSPDDWERTFRCAEKDERIIPLIGIHPWFVSKDWEEDFKLLKKLLEEHPDAGIGESGLDFQDRFANQAGQEASFAAHLDLARELDRPVAVHCVQAWGKLLELLEEHSAPRVLLHAFSGSKELIPQLIERNCVFSFGGMITQPRAKKARESVAAVPEERLLIETDAPDFLPDAAGLTAPNEPANLACVARTVAELRGISFESVAETTTQNARRFFGIK